MHTLECNLREKPFEWIIPYSDKHFRRSAVEWLVATNQVRISFYIRKMEISLMSYCVLIALKPKFSLILT